MMIFSFLFVLFFTFTSSKKGKKIIKGYDNLQIGPTSGNYADSNYISNHKIPTTSFLFVSNGDTDNYPLKNAFDDNTNTRWLSNQAETDIVKSSIFINFTQEVFFEALLYDSVKHTRNDIQYFDGYPSKIKIYTALNDEQFTLNTVFSGKPINPWQRIQYVLLHPVKCKRLKIEFSEVTEATCFGRSEKLVAAEGFTLLQSFEHDIVYYQSANGFYTHDNYINQHKIQRTSFTPTANDGDTSSQIDKAFDDNSETLWESSKTENDDFHPTISIDFKEPLLFEGFIYEINFYDGWISDHLYGFPYQIYLYSSLNDEPFTLHTIFIGSPSTDWRKVQYILTSPIKCNKIKLELKDISENDSKGKKASAKTITLLQKLNYDIVSYESINGNYDNSNFIKIYKIKRESFTPTTNDDDTSNQIDKAFDDNSETLWESSKTENDDFHPTISIDFKEPLLFEGFIYEINFYDGWISDHLYGFPYQIYLYSSLNDEPFTLHTIFIGSPSTDWRKVQYILTSPIKCNKIKLELRDISENDSKGKIASAKTITLLQSYNENILNYEKASGNNENNYYVEYYKVQPSEITATSNSEEESNPITNAFDEDSNTFWIAKDTESETFTPIITINLKKPITFTGFIYELNVDDGIISDTLLGFPSQILLYTALENDPLTLNTVFVGSPETSWRNVQYILSKPIVCSKIKLELMGISKYDKKGNVASAKTITLLQSITENTLKLERASGKYVENYFLEKNVIENTKYALKTTGDYNNRPINNVNNEKNEDYWIAEKENSDDYHPNITATFNEIMTISAILLFGTFTTKSNVRTFNGFPLKLNIYTSLDDNSLILNGKYSGIPLNDWDMIQVVLPESVKCKKVVIEFVHVTKNANANNKKHASITILKFIQDHQYDYITFRETQGIYTEENYILNHKESIDNMIIDSNGYLEGHPIKNAFDGDSTTSWVSPNDNNDDFHASIYIDFNKPIKVEAIIYEGLVISDGLISKHVTGFPNKMMIHSTINNETKSFMFVGESDTKYTKYQFVFPDPVACSHLELEFLEVTKEKKFSNEKYRALANGITVISQKYNDFSNGNYTEEFSTIYVNKSLSQVKVSDANFVDLLVPNDDDYLFIVNKQFSFENVEFSCTKDKISAIKSENSPQVLIKKCIFNSCSVRNSQQNGGAINFINCAIECTSSEFKNCLSKYGGGAYINFNQTLEHTSAISQCTFLNNEAVCGGGMFLYSVVETNMISVKKCVFKGNKINKDSVSSSLELTDGSALFMNVIKGKVSMCKFVENDKPSAVKVVNNFDSNLVSLNKDKSALLLIKDCVFEISANSKSSLTFVQGDRSVPIYVSNCIFTGKLDKDAHYIDDYSLSDKTGFPIIHINSCKFSSNKKRSMNLNSKNLLNLNNHEFNFKYNQISKNPIKFINAIFLQSIIITSTIIILILFVLTSNKNDDDESINNIQYSVEN